MRVYACWYELRIKLLLFCDYTVSFRFGYDASGNDVLDTSVDLQVHDIDSKEPAAKEEEEVEGVDEPSLTTHELAAMKAFICYERNLLELIRVAPQLGRCSSSSCGASLTVNITTVGTALNAI